MFCSDGDGLKDAEEGSEDVDLDGLPNFLDEDRYVLTLVTVLPLIGPLHNSLISGNIVSLRLLTSGASCSDGDGLTDAFEFSITKQAFPGLPETRLRDVDADGLVNWWDTDSDGDSMPDSQEGKDQTNEAGLPLFLEPFNAADGNTSQTDSAETCTSRCPGDGDKRTDFNRTNFDSDADGIPDAYEGTKDSDGDGMRDFEDPDRYLMRECHANSLSFSEIAAVIPHMCRFAPCDCAWRISPKNDLFQKLSMCLAERSYHMIEH